MGPIFLLIAEGVIFSDPFSNELSPCNFDTCSLRSLGTTSANGHFEIHFHRKESRRKAAIGFDSAELKRNRSPSQIAGAWALILPNDHPEQLSLVRNCRPRTINQPSRPAFTCDVSAGKCAMAAQHFSSKSANIANILPALMLHPCCM